MQKNINKNQFIQSLNCHSLTNGLAHTCHSLSKFYLRNKESYHKMPYLAHAQGMTGESGRSMVEMLGVLAVIGVLSVGGIAGYKMAMTKHKANELLNEASKRAVVVAAKIASGQFNASTALNEFESNTINGVSLSVTDNGDGTFSIKLSNMANNTDVCEQMTNMLGTDHINPSIEPNCAGLKYNNDLGEGTSGEKEMMASCNPECKAGLICYEGSCFDATTFNSQECGPTKKCSGENSYCATDYSYTQKMAVFKCVTGDDSGFSMTINGYEMYTTNTPMSYTAGKIFCDDYGGLASLKDIGLKEEECEGNTCLNLDGTPVDWSKIPYDYFWYFKNGYIMMSDTPEIQKSNYLYESASFSPVCKPKE